MPRNKERETREQTRERLSNLPDDAVNVGEPDAGGRSAGEPPMGREWMAGAHEETEESKKKRHD